MACRNSGRKPRPISSPRRRSQPLPASRGTKGSVASKDPAPHRSALMRGDCSNCRNLREKNRCGHVSRRPSLPQERRASHRSPTTRTLTRKLKSCRHGSRECFSKPRQKRQANLLLSERKGQARQRLWKLSLTLTSKLRKYIQFRNIEVSVSKAFAKTSSMAR